MVPAAHERQHVAIEALEDRVELLTCGGRRAGEAVTHLGRRRAQQRRDRGVAQPRHEHVDRAVAVGPHRLSIEPERVPVALLLTHCGASSQSGDGIATIAAVERRCGGANDSTDRDS